MSAYHRSTRLKQGWSWDSPEHTGLMTDPSSPLLPYPTLQWSSAPRTPAPGDKVVRRQGLEKRGMGPSAWPKDTGLSYPGQNPSLSRSRATPAQYLPHTSASPSVPKELPSPTHVTPATLPCTHGSEAWVRDMGARRDPKLLGPGSYAAPWGCLTQSRCAQDPPNTKAVTTAWDLAVLCPQHGKGRTRFLLHPR